MMISCKNILYQVFDPLFLESVPDEWGFVDHCPQPTAIGYATTLTPSVIQQALDAGIGLLVTHHDAWDFMYEERLMCYKLLKQYQISLIWCHLPLDIADFGPAAGLLTSLGCRITGKFAEDCGRVGEFSQELSLPVVVNLFYERLKEMPCRIHDASRDIQRISTTPGGGNLTKYLADALKYSPDLYVTGETSLYLLEYALYHQVSVLVYSHNYTENFGTRNLAQKIANQLEIPDIFLLQEPHF